MSCNNRLNFPQNFWAKVTKTKGCWYWSGYLYGKMKYGGYFLAGKVYPAHRISYELTKGSVVKGLFVLHSCDTPSCVNPDHLFLGNNAENMRDMFNKGRGPGQKLRREDALKIKEMFSLGANSKEVSSAFGVDERYARKIRDGEVWGWRPLTSI